MDNTLNSGAVALAAIAEAKGWGGVSRIAEKVGCRQSDVTRWIQGTRTPPRTQAAILEEAFGIPVRSWDLPSSDETGAHPAVPATGTDS